MNNIQVPQIVECQKIVHLNRITQGNQHYFNNFQPTYSNPTRLTLQLTEDHSLSRIKSVGLSSTKSKGLTLSSRKQLACKKYYDDQNIMFNPQNLQESRLIRRKTASTLVKTAHTIHYLGGSLSKSKEDPNKSNQVSKQKNISNKKIIDSYHLLSHSLKNQQNIRPQRDSSFSLNKEKYYKVKITPPKQVIVIDQSKGYSQQSKQSKVGKIHELKKKQFLRSSKKESSIIKNNYKDSNYSKLMSPPPLLKSSHNNFQIKSRRQFLESYIEKPMINSIIVSGNINNLGQQPQSPVLRLKKRLQLNSINCIYEKQTLVSNQVHDNKSSTIEVQQSLIVHRNVAQNIKPLMHKINLFSQGDDLPYKLYLGQQLISNLILTVKEMPLEHFSKFARELRIHQQIQSRRFDHKNILELIKHSTDSDKHVILKQPFTQTLHDYLQNYVMKKIDGLEFEYVVDSILRIIRKIVQLFEDMGMILKRKINLNDFVFVFLNLKFENLQMFELGNEQKLDKEMVFDEFRQQVQNYFNRISCGTLN